MLRYYLITQSLCCCSFLHIYAFQLLGYACKQLINAFSFLGAGQLKHGTDTLCVLLSFGVGDFFVVCEVNFIPNYS